MRMESPSGWCWLLLLAGCGQAAVSQSDVPMSEDTGAAPRASTVAVASDTATTTEPDAAFAELMAAAEAGDVAGWGAAEARVLAFGAAAVPTLARALGDERVLARETAASYLTQLGAEAAPACEALRRGLTDPSSMVRGNCAVALMWIDPEATETVPVLTALLDEADFNVRTVAVVALGMAQGVADVVAPELSRLLRDDEPKIRQLAARSLASLGPVAKKYRSALEELTCDSLPEVAIAAHSALRQLDGAIRDTETQPASGVE